LSPVQITTTHPHAQVLGWDVIEPLLRTVKIPVYLMGGLKREDLSKARERGAQGLAGITTFLDQ
jgi:8-oxo-dGTP diphosphatase